MTSRSILKAGIALVSAAVAMTTMANTVSLLPKVRGFNRLDLQTDASVVLRQDPEDWISVDATPKMASYLHIYKTGSTLHLGLKPHPGVYFKSMPHFVVFMRHINGLSVKNRGHVDVVGPINSNALSIALHNSGQILMPYVRVPGLVSLFLKNSGRVDIKEMHARHLIMQVNNSGHIQIHNLNARNMNTVIHNSGQVNIDSGYIRHQNITVHNAGSYHAGKAISFGANIHMRNAGDVRVRVNGPVSIAKHGSGHIYLYGHPIIKQVSSNHAGGVLVTD